MRKPVKIGLWAIGLLLGLPVLASLIVSIFFQHQVQEAIVSELNKRIEGRLELSQQARLSLLRHFPDAALELRGAVLYTQADDTLLSAQRIALRFKPFDLLKGKYRVKRIDLDRANLYLAVDEKGTRNFDIFKSGEDSDGDATIMELDVETARFRNSSFSYVDAGYPMHIAASINDITLRLNMKGHLARLALTGGVEWERFDIGDVAYASRLPMLLQLKGTLEQSKGHYSVEEGRLTVRGDVYALSGWVTDSKSATEMDLRVDGSQISLESLVALIPEAYRGNLDGLDSRGSITFITTIKGKSSAKEAPQVDVAFALQDATLIHPKLKEPIREVTIKGSFTNGNYQRLSTAVLDVPVLKGRFGPDPLDARLTLTNLSDPTIDLSASGSIALERIAGLMGFEGKGTIDMGHLSVKGKVADMAAARNFYRMEALGNLAFTGVEMPVGATTMSIKNGKAELLRNSFSISGLDAQVGKSDIRADISSDNFLTWLAGIWEQKPGNVLNVNATLTSANLDIASLEPLWMDDATSDKSSTPEATPSKGEAEVDYLPWFKGLRGTVNLTVGHLTAYSFEANQVKAVVRLSPYINRIETLEGHTARGVLKANGLLRVVGDQLHMEGKVDGSGLDIGELFTGFRNFGQDFIVAHNLKGRVRVDTRCFMAFNKSLELLYDKLDVQANMEITEGELVRFEPMNDLADYVKVKELEQIRFSTLRNTIHIRNNEVYIPAMYITSTAMNMWVSGRHTFGNDVDYQFKIDLLDVLARKVKVGRMKLEQAEQREEGVFNLYVTMTGNVDKPVFGRDKSTVLARFEASREWLDPQYIDVTGFDKPPASSRTPAHRQSGGASGSEEELEFIDW